MPSANEFETRNRARKALALARVLQGADGWSLDVLACADDELRRNVAALAQVREPSDETWQMAVGLLATLRDG